MLEHRANGGKSADRNGTGHGPTPTIIPFAGDPADLQHARQVRRLLSGEAVESVIDKVPHLWRAMADHMAATDDRDQAASDFLRGQHATEEMRRAWEACEGDEAASDAPVFSLDLIELGDFLDRSYRQEWLAKGILVAGDACIVGGPAKSLKTSILLDLAVSLGTGTPFLGRFEVPTPIRVGLISGETKEPTLQLNAREILRDRRFPRDCLSNVFLGFRLPQLCNTEHRDVLRREILERGLQAIAIDPLYLALLAGAHGVDAKDMFQMGPLLADVAGACLESGATPILCHHSVKRRDSAYEPLEFDDLAYAGFSQFARQWMLISRRERFDAESAVHKLHFHYGGSANHCGELMMDIETGRVREDLSEGRKWVVTIATPSESIAAKQEQARTEREVREAEKAKEADERAERGLLANVGKVIEAIRQLKGRDEIPTETRISAQSRLNSTKTKAAIAKALTDGRIVRYTAEVPPERKGPRTVEAFRITTNGKSGGKK